MKIVFVKSLFSISLLASMSTLAQAGECRVEGTAYIPSPGPRLTVPDGFSAEFSVNTWDNTEIMDYPGAQLSGSVGGPSGSDRTYSGPATPGSVIFGPYLLFEGISELALSSRVEFSTNWRPDGHEYCSNHKTKPNQARVCVETSIAYDPTSFLIDITQLYNGVPGTPIYSKVFSNINNFDHGIIYLPNIHCTGAVTQLEVRISNLTGGSVDFTVHNLHFDARWRYYAEAEECLCCSSFAS